MPTIVRDRVYQIYLDFLETAENKRRWNIFNDIPWSDLDGSKTTENAAQCVEIFCAEELFVPDYSAKGLEMLRTMFGMAWFQTCWAFEESRHGLVFREYLTRSGLRSEEEVAVIERVISAKEWTLPFDTRRRMACYGALQEAATFTAYKAQRDKARLAGDKVLEAVFFLVGRDEAAHAGFYRQMIELELESDRNGAVADLAHVLANFKMPGDGLIPHYRHRLQASGAGISPRVFLERVVHPLLMGLHISRQEMRLALAKHNAN